jgi:hypothetical protein
MKFVIGAKYKACPNCKTWVERRSGCSSIDCICGHRFCHICGISSDHDCDCFTGSNPIGYEPPENPDYGEEEMEYARADSDDDEVMDYEYDRESDEEREGAAAEIDDVNQEEEFNLRGRGGFRGGRRGFRGGYVRGGMRRGYYRGGFRGGFIGGERGMRGRFGRGGFFDDQMQDFRGRGGFRGGPIIGGGDIIMGHNEF